MTWYRVKITSNQYHIPATTQAKVLVEDKTTVRVQTHNANSMAMQLWLVTVDRLVPGYKLECINQYHYKQSIPLDNGTDRVIDVELLCNNAERKYLVAQIFADIYRREGDKLAQDDDTLD